MLFWYSGKEISDSNDELITDVEDETSEAITLPVVGTNKPTNERELRHFLDEDERRLQRSKCNNYVSYFGIFLHK